MYEAKALLAIMQKDHCSTDSPCFAPKLVSQEDQTGAPDDVNKADLTGV
jgi:hypothetical protein